MRLLLINQVLLLINQVKENQNKVTWKRINIKVTLIINQWCSSELYYLKYAKSIGVINVYNAVIQRVVIKYRY